MELSIYIVKLTYLQAYSNDDTRVESVQGVYFDDKNAEAHKQKLMKELPDYRSLYVDPQINIEEHHVEDAADILPVLLKQLNKG